jgi:hypothetical protein
MAFNMTWLCVGSGIERNDVFINLTNTKPPGPHDKWSAGVGYLEDWITEQPASLEAETGGMRGTLVTRDSGLKMILGEDGTARVYVSGVRRQALTIIHHEAIRHLGAEKTHASIYRSFTWPTMRCGVHAFYKRCPSCEINKAKRNVAHGIFRVVESGPPRSRYGMDYYGVTTGDILEPIDLDSLHGELSFHTSHSAKLCAKAIREKILSRHGNIDSLQSDHAKEFVGVVLSHLKEEVGYEHTTTGGIVPLAMQQWSLFVLSWDCAAAQCLTRSTQTLMTISMR